MQTTARTEAHRSRTGKTGGDSKNRVIVMPDDIIKVIVIVLVQTLGVITSVLEAHFFPFLFSTCMVFLIVSQWEIADSINVR